MDRVPELELGKELKDSLLDLENFRLQKVSVNYMDFMKVLIYILESKEPYTSGHSERVSLYSGIIAQDLLLTPQEKEDLQIATLLHDIGKIGLSNRLLRKNGLTQDDCSDIRSFFRAESISPPVVLLDALSLNLK
jgi:HD-GYP domain-containing protein (c-di-GMP phosphodiesterase class II)